MICIAGAPSRRVRTRKRSPSSNRYSLPFIVTATALSSLVSTHHLTERPSPDRIELKYPNGGLQTLLSPDSRTRPGNAKIDIAPNRGNKAIIVEQIHYPGLLKLRAACAKNGFCWGGMRLKHPVNASRRKKKRASQKLPLSLRTTKFSCRAACKNFMCAKTGWRPRSSCNFWILLMSLMVMGRQSQWVKRTQGRSRVQRGSFRRCSGFRQPRSGLSSAHHRQGEKNPCAFTTSNTHTIAASICMQDPCTCTSSTPRARPSSNATCRRARGFPRRHRSLSPGPGRRLRVHVRLVLARRSVRGHEIPFVLGHALYMKVTPTAPFFVKELEKHM